MEIGQSAGKSFAYLLGVFLGDGCVTHGWADSGKHRRVYRIFRLNTIDADFAATTKAALLDIGCENVSLTCHSVKKSSKPNWSLAARDNGYCERLVKQTNEKSNLPKDVFDWPREHQLAFIAGLMDSEGFVAANKSNPTNRRFYMGFKCCEAWVADFQRLLESIGIRTGKFSEEQPRKPGYKTPRRFHIKMQSWIDAGAYFNIARKNDRVKEWAEAGAYERRAAFPRRLTSETTCQTA